VLLSSDGTRHSWSDNVADEWVPETVQEAQLVACVDEEQERSIEVCLYNGPSITRYRYTVSVRLVQARTGAEVASTTVHGSMPRECRQTEDYDLTRLAGDHVPFAAVEEWMRVRVE
jgi:hypothetical protein